MTKRFLITIGLILAVVIGLSVVLISSCINNKDAWLDKKTGILLAKPGTMERLDEFVQSNEDKLEINLSKMNLANSIEIDDTGNKDTLIIDGNSGYFTDFTIQTNAKNVIIRNIAVKNIDKPFLVMKGTYVTLEFESVFIEVEKFANGVELHGERCLFSVVNTNRIKAGYGDFCQNGFSAIIGKNIEFFAKEGHSSKIELYGGKAGQGVSAMKTDDGYSYNPATRYANWDSGADGLSGGDSADGKDGKPAGTGGDALSCKEEIIVNKNIVLNCHGGDGNQSGAGASTGRGGVGQGALTPQPIRWRSYSGGRGGNSGDAGSGAPEVRSGAGIVCSQIRIASSASVTCQKGARGSCGAKGTAGEPGLGGYGSEDSVTGSNNKNKRGPTGTKGKDGLDGRTLNNDEVFDYIIPTIIGEIKVNT